jgi:DnaD/phage-associated family protein
MIIRAKRNSNYTVMSNVGLNDANLTFKAKGLLAFLLSKPDDWRTNDRYLATVGPDGRSAVQAGLKELEIAGYLKRSKYKDDRGQWKWHSIIYDEPWLDFPATEKPWLDFPSTDYPSTENQATITSTEVISTEVIKKEEEEEENPPPPPIDHFPKVIKHYERNIGTISYTIGEEIKDAVDEYPFEWIMDAIDESVIYNKRSWAYVRKILRTWRRDGRQTVDTNASNGADSVVVIAKDDDDEW